MTGHDRDPARGEEPSSLPLKPSAEMTLLRIGLSLRHPGLAHAIIDALALREIGRIVAECAGAKAADGEGRIERKPRLGRGPCLTHPTKVRLGGGEKEMRGGMISIGIDRPEQPNGGFLVAAEKELCEAGDQSSNGRHPYRAG